MSLTFPRQQKISQLAIARSVELASAQKFFFNKRKVIPYDVDVPPPGVGSGK